jgi:hypothetical protein
LAFGDYKFVKVLSSGGQGTVCLYRGKVTKENEDGLYAVKFDPETPSGANVLTECLFLKEY